MSRVLLPYVRAVPYALTGPATRVRESIASLLYSRAKCFLWGRSAGAYALGQGATFRPTSRVRWCPYHYVLAISKIVLTTTDKRTIAKKTRGTPSLNNE